MKGLVLALSVLAGPLWAAGYAELQARNPELFHPETGLRIARQRAPTPDDIPPPARLIGPESARTLLADGAIALDVFAASQSRYDDLDGRWLVSKQRFSLPGATWLPETGRGVLEPAIELYLIHHLERLTGGDRSQSIVVFCIADCWMSWNAAQRIAGLGYEAVYWFRLGTDGWLDIGEDLTPVDPLPVNTN